MDQNFSLCDAFQHWLDQWINEVWHNGSQIHTLNTHKFDTASLGVLNRRATVPTRTSEILYASIPQEVTFVRISVSQISTHMSRVSTSTPIVEGIWLKDLDFTAWFVEKLYHNQAHAN